ncbi:MAG: FAD:protein FMN transferase, partial [Actinobacteria bacterium]|nr:FAD:protein FMN transferase [Actinomycetota bacterium]
RRLGARAGRVGSGPVGAAAGRLRARACARAGSRPAACPRRHARLVTRTIHLVAEHDVTFPCMGCEFRLLVGAPGAAAAAVAARTRLEALDARLSRFRPDSELSRLNADPRETVPASPPLRATVRAALLAAERTGGLLDPTLVGALERAGYASSLAGATPGPVAEALHSAPPRRPARACPQAPWRAVRVDDEAGTIVRPPGLRLDSGGVGKGLAADLVAAGLARAGHARFAVDAAGDIRVGGSRTAVRPHEVEVAHPWREEPLGTLRIAAGAVATSGIGSRLWRTPDGRWAHHLLDPSSGAPAWTGLVAATALAPTALEAETRAKAALLSGPLGARRWLVEHGGIVVHDDGAAEWIGPARDHLRAAAPPRSPRLRLTLPAPAGPARGGRPA